MNDEDIRISSAQLRAMFGGVSDMTVWRWRHLPNDPLPEPENINGRNYWPLVQVRAWRERQSKRDAA